PTRGSRTVLPTSRTGATPRRQSRSARAASHAAPEPGRVVLLGPQRLQPTLAPTLESLGLRGPVATITAGWQERQAGDREVHEHLGRRSINLSLYQRGERVFRRDPELATAHHARQARLRELQDLYNVRLDHAMAAAFELLRRSGDAEALVAARRAAVEAIRD